MKNLKMQSIREQVNFFHYKKCYLEIKKVLLEDKKSNPEKIKEWIGLLDETYNSIAKRYN